MQSSKWAEQRRGSSNYAAAGHATSAECGVRGLGGGQVPAFPLQNMQLLSNIITGLFFQYRQRSFSKLLFWKGFNNF